MTGAHNEVIIWFFIKQTPLWVGVGEGQRLIMQGSETWTPLCGAFTHADANSICTQNKLLPPPPPQTRLALTSAEPGSVALHDPMAFMQVMCSSNLAAAWTGLPIKHLF